MSDILQIDTGKTLSILSIPGQDIRINTAMSDSIFTFGSFRLETNTTSDILSGSSNNISFNSLTNLQDLNGASFAPNFVSFSVQNNELHFDPTDPLSYAYFSSFYSSVANSINNITLNFPYAILGYDNGTGNTILNYSTFQNGLQQYSTFLIPYSSATNQGNVLINSGSTTNLGSSSALVNASSQALTLSANFDQFAIQLSGNSTILNIISYNYVPSSGGTSYMQFVVDQPLFTGTTTATTFTNPIYVRPSSNRYNLYLKSLSRLDTQVLTSGQFLIPNASIPNQQDLQTFTWPRTLDGFAPDSYGGNFENYQNNILTSASLVDNDKTNLMLRCFFPENLIENDDQFQDMRYLAEVYSKEFDNIKQFIDGIAFAHSVNYSSIEAVPNKFLTKLGDLLGWELSSSFSDIDMFEYLVGDLEGGNNSKYQVNLEIWRRILINIVWLYKKKGTRDALQFIFKLIGAPDALINLNEFIYQINPSPADTSGTPLGVGKINENGYINYNASQYIFQEGGPGRGNGQDYINQWRPEFDPIKTVDNIKVQTGDTNFFGTENIINTKELDITISPANAIEDDFYNWVTSTDVCWRWGTTSTTFAFSALTVPFEILPTSCDNICMEKVSGMTFSEFYNNLYMTSIDPTTRKTIDQSYTSFFYLRLRNLYLYYYQLNNPKSNRLTFGKLEYFINLLEVQYKSYFLQLIPATSIFQGVGTEYRNTVFNRQKFVYKEGINRGSEFQVKYDEPISMETPIICLTPNINNKYSGPINIIQVRGQAPTNLKNNIQSINIGSTINENGINNSINITYLQSSISIIGSIVLSGLITGSIVSAATLSLTSPSYTANTTTDLLGNYIFTGLTADSYMLTTVYRGYKTYVQPVTVVSSETLNYRIEIQWDNNYETWGTKANDIIFPDYY